MSDARPVLAFIEPGRHKSAFLTELSKTLSDRFRCVFYSRKSIPRGILRQGRVTLYPGAWSLGMPRCRASVDPSALQAAIGAKAWAKLGKRAGTLAPACFADLERFFDRYRVDAIFVWNGATLAPS